MRLSESITFGCLIGVICFISSCQSETKSANGSVDNGNNGSEPLSCMGWISFYAEEVRLLDSLINFDAVNIKDEGYDQYNSPNKLEGVYTLKDRDLSVDRIGVLAKNLAYKLCLSNVGKIEGVLMDCKKRKVQVAIARDEENYRNQDWAVIYNIFPANKKGELTILDFVK